MNPKWPATANQTNEMMFQVNTNTDKVSSTPDLSTHSASLQKLDIIEGKWSERERERYSDLSEDAFLF